MWFGTLHLLPPPMNLIWAWYGVRAWVLSVILNNFLLYVYIGVKWPQLRQINITTSYLWCSHYLPELQVKKRLEWVKRAGSHGWNLRQFTSPGIYLLLLALKLSPSVKPCISENESDFASTLHFITEEWNYSDPKSSLFNRWVKWQMLLYSYYTNWWAKCQVA